MLGTPESERFKVTALNLFHPTASPPFQKVNFFILRHSLKGRGKMNFDIIFRCGEEIKAASMGNRIPLK
jgi:hypothetical protein